MDAYDHKKNDKKKDLTKDHSPFSAKTSAFQQEEDALANFVTHETPEQRIESFVEDFAAEYQKDPEQVYMLLQDIYADLEEVGHVENVEDEIMEVLKRLKKKTEKE
jgi:hypothetical protein